MAAGYAAGPARGDPQGREAGHRPLHRAAGDPDRRLRGAMAGIPRRVYALTGLGFLGARADRLGRAGAAARSACWCAASRRAQTHYLFENPDDPALLGLDPADGARVTIVGGAGVDPERLARPRCRRSRRCRVAVVARMLWSKGIDLAVEAVRLARARGAPRSSCRSTARPTRRTRRRSRRQTLRAGAAEPGIAWHGADRRRRPRSGASITSAACPRAAARACRARCSKAPPADAPSSPPTCRAAARWCGTASKGGSCPPNDPAALADAFVAPRRRPGAASPAWARPPGPASSTASPSAT